MKAIKQRILALSEMKMHCKPAIRKHCHIESQSHLSTSSLASMGSDPENLFLQTLLTLCQPEQPGAPEGSWWKQLQVAICRGQAPQLTFIKGIDCDLPFNLVLQTPSQPGIQVGAIQRMASGTGACFGWLCKWAQVCNRQEGWCWKFYNYCSSSTPHAQHLLRALLPDGPETHMIER